ncbi:MAG: amidohydrolase family protein, partial [Myxococcota bacterium]|nr:amidohydrolase family protein [Myxococcota bacterium]
TLNDEEIRGYDPRFKMAPPLRAEEDRMAMLEALKDGTIACIATDHAPHATVDKEVEFELASFGIVGLETAWGLTYRLVKDGSLDLMTAVRLLTSGPAECFGLDLGTLGAGRPADLVLVDPDATQRFDVRGSFSKGANTPFGGWELPGRVERTIFGGRTVYLWDGEQGILGPVEA